MDRVEKIALVKSEIRQKVQARMKKGTLNYRADDAFVRRQIEVTLDEVVKSKLDDALDEGLKRYLIEEILNEIFGFGPIDRFMNDMNVWEIMVNGPKEIYVEREGRLQKTDAFFENAEQLSFYIDRLLSPSGRHVSEMEPYIDARFPDGSRINVVRNPVAPYGPIVTIRKANRKILGIQDLIARKTLDESAALFLKACVHNHLNIVIAGAPGAGKTTILNILASYIPETERVITIEDTMELRVEGKHRVALETRTSNVEGKGEIAIRDLVRNALHMRPDRIIIGEVRGEEALDMLQSMNIGRVGSMTTLHANTALDALMRLETMAMMGNVHVSADLIRRQIISAIDLVISVDRLIDGTRCVMSIAEVIKASPTEYTLKDIYAGRRQQDNGRYYFTLERTGYKPEFLAKFIDVEGLPQEFRG